MGASRWVGGKSVESQKKKNWVRGREKIKFQKKKLIFEIRETKENWERGREKIKLQKKLIQQLKKRHHFQ